MATQSTASDSGKPNIGQRIRSFYEEVKVEYKKITWPSTDELKVSTKVTLYLLGILAAITFGYDLVFNKLVLVLLSIAS